MLHLRHNPGTGNDRVCLEELQSGRSLHLGGDHTQKIVLDPDDVHGRDLVPVHDELESPRELLRHLPFPMEIHTDSHSVKDERRFGEHSGLSLSLEDQLIVKDSVIGNAPG